MSALFIYQDDSLTRLASIITWLGNARVRPVRLDSIVDSLLSGCRTKTINDERIIL